MKWRQRHLPFKCRPDQTLFYVVIMCRLVKAHEGSLGRVEAGMVQLGTQVFFKSC